MKASARIEVFVENINEKPATINLVFLTTSNQSAKIAENATSGTLVVRISVSDPDNPNDYFSNINVSLQGDLGNFGLKTDDNVIYYIFVKRELDRETVPKYDLNVIAVDSGNQPTTVIFGNEFNSQSVLSTRVEINPVLLSILNQSELLSGVSNIR
jgi:hypothetical protein